MKGYSIPLAVIGIISGMLFLKVLRGMLEEYHEPIMSPSWRRRGYLYLFAFGVESAFCLSAAWLAFRYGGAW